MLLDFAGLILNFGGLLKRAAEALGCGGVRLNIGFVLGGSLMSARRQTVLYRGKLLLKVFIFFPQNTELVEYHFLFVPELENLVGHFRFFDASIDVVRLAGLELVILQLFDQILGFQRLVLLAYYFELSYVKVFLVEEFVQLHNFPGQFRVILLQLAILA